MEAESWPGEGRQEESDGNVISPSKHERKVFKPTGFDDISSTTSCCAGNIVNPSLVVSGSKKALEGIVQELDDYFLTASASANEIAVLMDIANGDAPSRKSCRQGDVSNSAKVFSALTGNWSSKHLQLDKDDRKACGPSAPCSAGAHCISLEKLYAAEQKLYKELKEERAIKLEHEKKSTLLLRLREEDCDLARTEKISSGVEDLEAQLRRLQCAISGSCTLILGLVNSELKPQLIALISGLKNMWMIISECHRVQHSISEQLNHRADVQTADFTTDHHHRATAQLETELISWHTSFCKLLRTQHEYVRTLGRWIQSTNSITDLQTSSSSSYSCSSVIHRLCDEWLLISGSLSDKEAADSIKGLLSSIQLIKMQQGEEKEQHKKLEKMEKRLQKYMESLAEMERKHGQSWVAGDPESHMNPKNPMLPRLRHVRVGMLQKQVVSPNNPMLPERVKISMLQLQVESEKTKHQDMIAASRELTLGHLEKALPSVFLSLQNFSHASSRAFDIISRATVN